jgi:2-oxoacid:acceptor oxidoreductase gamma subunit (pyruvate/2-ketoisovalerate family)
MAAPPPYYTFMFVGHSEQGVKAAARILAKAALASGFKAQAYCPKVHGVGDGHAACTRVGKGELLEKGPIERADFSVFFDPSLLKERARELKEKSVVIVNSMEKVTSPALKKNRVKAVSLDAYAIASSTIAKPWPATALLGALAKAFPRIPLKAIKSAIQSDFYYSQEQNVAAADEGFRSAK